MNKIGQKKDKKGKMNKHFSQKGKNSALGQKIKEKSAGEG